VEEVAITVGAKPLEDTLATVKVNDNNNMLINVYCLRIAMILIRKVIRIAKKISRRSNIVNLIIFTATTFLAQY